MNMCRLQRPIFIHPKIYPVRPDLEKRLCLLAVSVIMAEFPNAAKIVKI